MRIGILLHPYGISTGGGFARAILELVRGLLRLDRENEYAIYMLDNGHAPPELPPGRWTLRRVPKRGFWLNRGLWWTPDADAAIFNAPVLPLLRRPPNPVIIVYDFPYLHMDRGWRNRVRATYERHNLLRARSIVSISESTKTDMIRFLGIPERRIRVVPLGFNRLSVLPAEPVALPPRYFVNLAALKRRKNVLGLVRAYREYRARGGDASLLLLPGWTRTSAYACEVRAFVREHGLEPHIVWMEHLTDGQLRTLYAGARALVYPSLVEGFGLPVLEAMDCGTPVITSNRSSLPEVGGEAAVLVDPEDPRAIAEAMLRIDRDAGYRERRIADGYRQAARFSWDAAARGLLDAVRGA